MELKEYVAILKKNIFLILITIIIFVGAAIAFTTAKADNYQASGAIEIIRVPSVKQSNVDYFQYDNYYATEVSSSVTDNMIGWISSASIVSEVYQKAGYEVPTASVKELGATFSAKKKMETAAVIDLGYSSSSKERSAKMMDAAITVLKGKIEDYNTSDSSSVFITKSSDPVVVAEPKTTTINALIAGFVGLILSLGIISVKEALKK